jgi:hypothetical protein
MDLSVFLSKNLFIAGQNLFEQLGIKLNSDTTTSLPVQEILKDLYKDRLPFNHISESYFLGLIDNNLFDENLFNSPDEKISYKQASAKIDNKYKGIIVFAVKLKDHYPNRTQLSELTRAFNRASRSIPVILLTRYYHEDKELLSFSTIERTPYEQTWREGEKTGKVSLLRDIKLTNTHTGHKKILLDLQIDSSVKNFDALYRQWQEVFNVQLLNKKFFQELANWYFWATSKVNFPDDVLKDKEVRNATSVIRLLTRLIFVWFIKEKGLVTEDLFDEEKLKQLLKFTDPQKSTFYKAILQNLFFATLNTEMGNRRFRGLNDNGRDAHYFIHNVFRYKSQFIKPQETLEKLFDPIPFLNGGLFECLDKEIEIKNKLVPVRIDGFSDRADNPLKVPDQLFFDPEKEVNLNKVYGTKNKKYKVRGLISLLSSYKFTIAENTPLEEDIALDPELLGKVFENLLANYNPETQATARKQTGSFYTPREIVNYMIDESLVAHLKTKMLEETFGYIQIGDEQIDAFGNKPRKGQLKIEEDVNPNRWLGKEVELEKELRNLLSYSETDLSFTEEERRAFIKAVDNIKVIDPACGSGAFPMGILHKLVLILHKLDPKNIGWKKRQLERAEAIEEATAREEAINKIENAFEKNELDYGRKLYLIENCIYGIDIQPIAAQISKLRFFISLIVDQKVNWKSPESNYDIEPLPNLETKFVAANTLIGIERPEELRFNKAIEIKENELRKNRERYFTARTAKTKERYRTKDKELREEIVKLIKEDFEEFSTDKQNQIKGKEKLITLYKKELDKTYDKLKDKKLTEGQKKILEQQKEKQLKAIKAEEKKIQEFLSQLLDNSVIDDTASTLASWDPYDQNSFALFFDMEWMYGLKDGFNIVIGNPPYGVSIKGDYRDAVENNLGKVPDYEIYYYFIEVARRLLNHTGIKSYILPNTFLFNVFATEFRKRLLDQWNILCLCDCTAFKIFEEATIYNTITLMEKNSAINKYIGYKPTEECSNFLDLSTRPTKFILKEELLGNNQNWALVFRLPKPILELTSKIKRNKVPLAEFFIDYSQGLIAYDRYRGQDRKTIKNRIFHSRINKAGWKKWLWGEDVTPYLVKWNGIEYINYPSGIANPRDPKYFKGERILVREITNPKIYAGYTTEESYNDPAIINILKSKGNNFDLKCLLALLNSKLATFYHFNSSPKATKGSFPKILVDDIKNFPLPILNDNMKNSINKLVNKILILKKQNSEVDTTALERQIDKLVYKLYDLTDDEIAIIEGKE